MKSTCKDALAIYVQHSSLTFNIKVQNIIRFLHNYENTHISWGDLLLIHAYITTTLVNISLTETNIGNIMVSFSKLKMPTCTHTPRLINELVTSITQP